MTLYLAASQLSGLSIGDKFVADYMERVRLDEISLDNKTAIKTLTEQDVLETLFWRLEQLWEMIPEDVDEVDLGWPADVFSALVSIDSFKLRQDRWKFGPFFFYDLADCLLGDEENVQ